MKREAGFSRTPDAVAVRQSPMDYESRDYESRILRIVEEGYLHRKRSTRFTGTRLAAFSHSNPTIVIPR